MRKTTRIGLSLALAGTALFAGLENTRQNEMSLPRFFEASSLKGPLGWRHAVYGLQRFEWNLQSTWFKLRGEQALNPNVAVIGIDDASLKAFGEWPWSRAIHAKLIQVLSAAPPKALLFDVIFAEPMNRDPRGDGALVVMSKGNPWVVHAFYAEKMEGFSIQGRQNPFPALANSGVSLASVNATVDPDGVLRRALIQQEDGGKPEYLLSAVGAAKYLGRPVSEIVGAVPRTKPGHLLVNWIGGENQFPFIPYEKVLTDPAARAMLAGKVVIVGSVAVGTYDHYPTPFSPILPGLDFHANVIHNILSGNGLRVASSRLVLICLLLVGVWSGWGLVKLSPGWSALGSIALAGGLGTLAYSLFVSRSIYLEVATPLAALAFNFVVILLFRFFTEEKEKRWVKGVFGQYVSPKVLDVLMDDPSKLWLGGERREMTMFFSDVAGFTTFSERMKPERLVELLNRYLSAMAEEIFRNDGYLNKFMGDGIMAFWNAPMRQPNHAEMACRAALACQRRIKEFNDALLKDGGIPLVTRIGIDSGYVVVGNMGTAQKMDFTVMGDHVNLASRLEGANKAFGTSIMISEFTYEVVQNLFDVRFLDILRVPGRARPVKTYELLAEKGKAPSYWSECIPEYHAAVQLYADQEFEKAREKFAWVNERVPGGDRASQTYLSRCERFVTAPPPKEWDGVFELKVK